ncbi:MAG: hypothetical protein AAF411_18960, partial [Myxococcota bacterium]
QTASPVCCPEAACYHRFLQPNGLHELAEDLRRTLGWLLRPDLELRITPTYEPGYAFREPYPLTFNTRAYRFPE